MDDAYESGDAGYIETREVVLRWRRRPGVDPAHRMTLDRSRVAHVASRGLRMVNVPRVARLCYSSPVYAETPEAT